MKHPSKEHPESGAAQGTTATRTRLAEVRALLEQAWEQPAENRRAWLAQECDSPELLAEVMSLLDADAEAGDFLGEASAQRAWDLLQDSPILARFVDREIGSYRIIEPVAQGGMGEVFLAERIGADFQQTVAIKLARRFEDSEERRRRFIEEQRILARLEHPNIARLIDGGIWDGDELSAQGRPYLVMEFVDGQPITEYCEQRGLELQARLELFCAVCDAVHFAHRNLVLHRDIKPSNILVSAEGHVKLLDFGIATVLAEGNTDLATRTLLMTPEFAAPEQIQGKALTTSTDIYALGLLLYELVCGHRAYRLEGMSPAEVETQICHAVPVAPSLRAGKRSLPQKLSGDLDRIVLKALAKEPERRYPSARALAEDLQNYLEGRPVTAQPDTRRYRIRKFIARHRWETAWATMAVAVLLTSTIVAANSASEARRALAQSQIEASKSAQVVAFLREMFAAADPRQTGGETYTVQDVLESGTRHIADLVDQPEVQGLLLSELGEIHTTLGNYDEAVDMLEQAAILQQDQPLALAETLHRRSIAEDERGDFKAAEHAAHEALRIRQSVMQPDSPAVGQSLDRLGAVIAGQGRYEEAQPLITQAAQLLTASAGNTDKRTLTALHNLAWLQGRLGNYADSESTYRHVISLAEKAYGPNDPELLVTRDSLAVMLRRQGKLDEAESIYRDVLNRRIATLGAQHREVGYTQHNLARLLFERHRPEEAATLFERALANWRESLGPDHANLGIGLSNLGRTQEELGRLDEAEQSYRQSIEILEMHEAGFADRLGDTSLRLGRLLTESGDAQSGLPYLQNALEIRKLEENELSAVAVAQLELGNCLLALGEYDLGRALIEEGLETIDGIPDIDESLLNRAHLIGQRLNS